MKRLACLLSCLILAASCHVRPKLPVDQVIDRGEYVVRKLNDGTIAVSIQRQDAGRVLKKAMSDIGCEVEYYCAVTLYRDYDVFLIELKRK